MGFLGRSGLQLRPSGYQSEEGEMGRGAWTLARGRGGGGAKLARPLPGASPPSQRDLPHWLSQGLKAE